MQKSGAAVCTIFTACTALIQGYCLVQGFGVCLHSPFARLLPLFKATALCKAIHIMPFHIFETVSTWQLILRPWWHQPACKQARAPPPAVLVVVVVVVVAAVVVVVVVVVCCSCSCSCLVNCSCFCSCPCSCVVVLCCCCCCWCCCCCCCCCSWLWCDVTLGGRMPARVA